MDNIRIRGERRNVERSDPAAIRLGDCKISVVITDINDSEKGKTSRSTLLLSARNFPESITISSSKSFTFFLLWCQLPWLSHLFLVFHLRLFPLTRDELSFTKRYEGKLRQLGVMRGNINHILGTRLMIVTRSNTTLVVDSRAIIKYAEYISLHNEPYNYYTVPGGVTDKNKEEKENLKLEVKQKMAICFMKKNKSATFV